VRQIIPQSTLNCGKKTTEAIKTAVLLYGAEKSKVKLWVSTPQADFSAEIYTAFQLCCGHLHRITAQLRQISPQLNFKAAASIEKNSIFCTASAHF